MRRMHWWLGSVLSAVVLAACGGSTGTVPTASNPQPTLHTVLPTQAVDFPHIHGMGFTADGELVVAAHTGLRVYQNGQWHLPTLPVHDYMGYAPTDQGFYSSGHPGPGSRLVNPLGLVKSTDGGQTLTPLGFAGARDFHLMAAGYTSHVLYVFNPAPIEAMGAGLQWSEDDGVTWHTAALGGVRGEPIQLTVHPSDPGHLALVTEGGLFESVDYGMTFRQIPHVGVITAATFSPKGDALLFAGTDSVLFTHELVQRQTQQQPLPPLRSQDAVAWIAMNPALPTEMIIATFERDLYRSQDRGTTWQPIVQNGMGLSHRQ